MDAMISNEGQFSAAMQRHLVKQHSRPQRTVLVPTQSSSEMKSERQVPRSVSLLSVRSIAPVSSP